MFSKISILVTIPACSILTLAQSAQAIPMEQQVNEVVSYLVGVMDTSAQAAVNSQAPSVRMTICKVSLQQETTSVLLYQEQALNQSLNQPYHQRFLEIRPSLDGQQVESKSYKPLNPNSWIGFCNRPESDRLLQITDLDQGICSVFFKPVISIYVGNTQTGGCPANARGAVTITNTIILDNRGMDTWDRGFDAAGNQVWGAKEDPYQYRRRD